MRAALLLFLCRGNLCFNEAKKKKGVQQRYQEGCCHKIPPFPHVVLLSDESVRHSTPRSVLHKSQQSALTDSRSQSTFGYATSSKNEIPQR